ncbi:MAG: acyl carrier protein [Gammaproteobacteria bacterium]|nr:acyl carrier protein [Gammaproteobacteria bacterium]|tara:strand:- start:61 stop:315 length:255 start_codon:yes stop_codon:yes gene_type:complete
MMTTIEQLQPIFRSVFEDDDLIVTREMSANDVENWDSLNHITLIVEIEMYTGLTLTTEDLISLANVGDFVDMLESKGFVPNGAG